MNEAKTAANIAKVGAGAVFGAVSKGNPRHLTGPGMGIVNASANFGNAAAKSFKNHKSITTALGAGAAAAIGHGAVVTAVVAAAPVVAVGAAVGAAGVGMAFLTKKLWDKVWDKL